MYLGPESRAVSLWTSEFMREGSQDLDSKAKLGIIIKPFSEFGQPGPHRDWYDHHNNSHHGMDDHHGLTMAHRPQSHLPAPPCESPAGGDWAGLPTCGTQTPGGSQHQPSPFHWMKGEFRRTSSLWVFGPYFSDVFQKSIHRWWRCSDVTTLKFLGSTSNPFRAWDVHNCRQPKFPR